MVAVTQHLPCQAQSQATALLIAAPLGELSGCGCKVLQGCYTGRSAPLRCYLRTADIRLIEPHVVVVLLRVTHAPPDRIMVQLHPPLLRPERHRYVRAVDGESPVKPDENGTVASDGWRGHGDTFYYEEPTSGQHC